MHRLMVAWRDMRVESSVALKEWAVLCALVGAGRHSVLLRKGGIREPRPAGQDGTFVAEHRRFWLLPTFFHLREPGRAGDLAPEALALAPALLDRAPPAGRLRLELFAEVVAAREVADRGRLRPLAGAHGLSEACVDGRFAYRRPGLVVLILRAWRTRQAIEIAERAEYAGCVSWVHLDAALADEAEPVLSDAAHAARVAAIEAALEAT